MSGKRVLSLSLVGVALVIAFAAHLPMVGALIVLGAIAVHGKI